MTNSTFTANTATNSGGAIFDFDGSDDAVTGSGFYRNETGAGGTLSLNPALTVRLRAGERDDGGPH